MRQIGILLFFCLFSIAQTFAQGIEFFHGTWDEALAKAKAEEKVIFVDAYAVWCGPCKRMAKNVFPLPEVGEFYNKNFISLKMDMEKGEGLTFRKKYPVSAFPTLFFIDHNGKVVHKEKGAKQAADLIKLGGMALRKVDTSGEYEKAYAEGDRDPEMIYKYVKALNKAGKPSLKIANDYIKSQKDLTTPENLKFILEAATEADSRIFDLLIKHKAQIASLVSEEDVNNKIEAACMCTAKKAVEFESEDLHEEAKSKMKKHYPAKGSSFALDADMKFYKSLGDSKSYLKVCNEYIKKEVKNDATKLHSLAASLSKDFEQDEKALKLAEKLAKKAAENGGQYQYYYTYADILFKNGKKKEAISMAQKSLELAKGDKRAEMGIQQLIDKLKMS